MNIEDRIANYAECFDYHNEPLLNEDEIYMLKGIKTQPIYQSYIEAERMGAWSPESISWSNDRRDYKKLSKPQRRFVDMILAFFAIADGIVGENVTTNMCSEIKSSAARLYLSWQGHNEGIHQRTYWDGIEAIYNDKEAKRIVDDLKIKSSLRRKRDWSLKWLHQNIPLTVRIVAFAVIECIFFCTSFSIIFWLKKKGILSGLCLSNDYISRDESQHILMAGLFYNEIHQKLPTDLIHAIINEAIDVEIEFIEELFDGETQCEQLSVDDNIIYAKLNANALCRIFGIPEIYKGISNPYPFCDVNSMVKTNFFERRTADYILLSADHSKPLIIDDNF